MNWFNRFFSQFHSPSGHLNKHQRYQFSQYTDIGGRDYNEDRLAHYFDDTFLLLVVADGLGGHESGEVAAQLICDTLIKQVKRHKNQLNTHFNDAFQTIISNSIQRVSQILSQKRIDAHTTLACTLINLKQRTFICAHVGDSRIYYLDHQAILWRSRDHSVVQMLLEDGEVTEDEMGRHPEQGMLTRSISAKNNIKASISAVRTFQPHQALLLCTDGFWENLPRTTLIQLSQAHKNTQALEKSLSQWVNQAKQNAGADCDNITAQLLVF